MRVMIVDDHEIVREGVRATLSNDARIEVVGEAATGREALRLVRRTLPDVALVDLRLPDMRGEDLTRELTRDFPSTAVVILTTYLSEETVRGALDAGAAAYVTKAAGLPELMAALERIMEGGAAPGAAAGPQIVKQLHALVESRMSGARPTPQQERVLELAAQGFTNQEIGNRLFISESTVRFHVQKLKAKFEARTKTELIAKAIRTGFIAPAGEAAAAGPET
ncbi:response regulator transcription factor [Conexibacter sp. JD483]|uniref:response regulator transcription factor n=1 Tax=unclassified Conexibacter TaxID=2627773 RepID=UPI002724BC82|nr:MULTISPECIES: response regulator transcription factor [unclassified Conexibacter]MDO8187797.1 response regulator transcription factor [Conexibacter sp. CPCC 205706]MDO8199994.1 response regulator transcription factor [Conexibacter sp. CPCC 205762]MDR9369521.1 response regulator transcription factor [Conexibacter sp. JD483]